MSVRSYAELVKFSHTVFALPFALVAMLVAAGGLPPLRTAVWILAATVSARTMAMAFNRIADVRFDRENPRTAGRPSVTGEVPIANAWVLWGVSTAGFFLSAWMLNPLCLALAPVVWAVLNGYSLTKRFTNWTHLFLGLALGLAPLGAWAAVTGSLDWRPIPLGLAVLFWVAGFDVLYSLQDEEVDRRQGLRSLAVALGAARALWVSRLFHVLTVPILVLFGAATELGFPFYIGVGVVAVALAVEQSLVSAEDRSRMNAAFFTANGFVSLSLLAATCVDLCL